MNLGLEGKSVIVSAGSKGLGRACAERFLEEGAQVAIFGRDPETLEKTLTELSGAGRIIGRPCDGGDRDALADWVGWASDELGAVDVVVSNVSAFGGIPRTVEGWDMNYNVDVLSAVTLFDHTMERLKASDIGSFIQMATITAVEYHGFPGGGLSYGACKAALVNYVSQLAQEYMAEGIRANCVSPGPIYFDGGNWETVKSLAPDYFDANRDQHPTKRFGKPEEVSSLVAYLGSSEASWVTGQNIVVDGGFTRRVHY